MNIALLEVHMNPPRSIGIGIPAKALLLGFDDDEF